MLIDFDNTQYDLVLPDENGFDHHNVDRHFGGDLTYIADMDYNDNTWSFYHVANPDISKGHHNIMTLIKQDKQMVVSGMPMADFDKDYRYQLGKACGLCNTIIYSLHRHDYRVCKCEDTGIGAMVDGGKSYFRASFNGTTVDIDLLNKTIVKQP